MKIEMDTKQTIFGLPVVVTESVAEGEILLGSMPIPEHDNMTLDEYAAQCAKSFIKVKLSDDA